MTVELVGIADSENRVFNKLPTVVRTNPAEASTDGVPDGGYRCLITEVDDHLVVWDLGAKGGTFVNGVPVVKATLNSTDTLRLGDREFSVRYRPEPRRYVLGLRC